MRKDRHAPVQITIAKRNGHAAPHGGAWKVALADFMTAMFCLFLVLWLTNQSSDMKSAIAGYFQDPLGRASEQGSSILPGEGARAALVERAATQEEVMNLRRDRLMVAAKRIEGQLDADPILQALRHHIEIQLTEDGLRIELLEDSTGYFFERSQPTPNVRGTQILALLGAELGRLPLPVRVEGHTDAYQFKSDGTYSNWELSADRANAARRIMTMSGLAPDQIAQVTALADRNPRVAGNRYASANRRVTITMLLRDPRESGEATTPPRQAGPG
jgi:chemotaxis protein MotB